MFVFYCLLILFMFLLPNKSELSNRCPFPLIIRALGMCPSSTYCA